MQYREVTGSQFAFHNKTHETLLLLFKVSQAKIVLTHLLPI